MAKFVIECFDERGDRLEAHCEQSSGDPHYRFTVELISETGLRGHFLLDVPADVPICIALHERILADGIHAHN